MLSERADLKYDVCVRILVCQKPVEGRKSPVLNSGFECECGPFEQSAKQTLGRQTRDFVPRKKLLNIIN